MKRIFVDTNVIIDFLADRQPFSLSASVLFEYALAGKVKIFISAVSYNNIYYITKQSLSHKDTIHLLSELAGMTEIVDVTGKIIHNALKSDFKDFEDAIQYQCAQSVNRLDVIVTRNTKDFKKSLLPVMTTDEVLRLMAEQ